MEKNIKKILYVSIIVVCILLVANLVLFFKLEKPADIAELKFYEFRFEVFKYVFGGILLGVLGLIIPQLLATAQYNYKLLIEGRSLYSQAKTGIIYLPFKLPFMSYKEGIELIEKIHQTKHIADFYIDNKGMEYRNRFEEFKAVQKLKTMRDEISNDKYSNSDEITKIKILDEALKQYN